MMDSKILREAALSYLAVYDEEVRDRMEELGMISEEDAYYEAREPGVKPYRPNPTQAEVRADAAAARRKQVEASKGQKGYGDKVGSSPELTKKPDAKTAEWLRKTKSPYGKRIVGQMGREYGSRTAAGVTRVVKGAGEPQAVTLPRSTRVSREIVRKPKTQSEEFDIYDVVLSHLLDEGYAETLESAEAIMVNMSEEWIDAIIEG
jgi:hypothetical protein